MANQLISSQKEKKHERKLLEVTLLVFTLSCIVFLSIPVLAEVSSEEQTPIGTEYFALLESSHSNAKVLLELAGDNESLPLAYEKFHLGEESAIFALSLNSTGLYTEAYEKIMEALEYYGEAITLALEAMPHLSIEPSDNLLDPQTVRGKLDRTWDYLNEMNATYIEQNATVVEVEILLSDALTSLQIAEERFAEENYEATTLAISDASDALNDTMSYFKMLVQEKKAEKALKFLDYRKASLRGLEEYLTQKYGVLSSANSEIFVGARNTNQLIRSLIESGEIEDALDQLDLIHKQMYETLEYEGLSKDDLKEMKALDKTMMKAERLNKKNATRLDENKNNKDKDK